MAFIGLIRHGRTDWNREGRAQGQKDVPLSEEGLAQARIVAERLGEEEWHAIYASDLSRARRTAEMIAERLGIPDIVYDARLREIGGGRIEGTTESERVAKWGPEWERLDLDREPPASVAARGAAFLEELHAREEGRNVLVVGHGAWMKHCLNALVPDIDTSAPRKNTSVTKIRKSPEGWACDLYNCAKHLEGREGAEPGEI
ncbi:histidine phosphatase family protein [Cohnella nanjingensis]|uniref:Histidine phosphatase family protein n=1 Tax=Cohnella nanjingensis TaxID=1387779 RepID=A0A7X0VF95_9BACL|nr:histidine phosphatase family protein [Cohnella nanjingensis]MBB6671591.1 histidine phosphatase family protein [Cohnella nanjingensis]